MHKEKAFSLLQSIHKQPAVSNRKEVFPDTWIDPYISRKWIHNVTMEAGQPIIDRTVRWITDRVERVPDSQICHFRCGPGLYTMRFAQKGANVSGVDFSKSIIDYAKNEAEKHNRNVKYFLSDDLEFELDEKFDVILLTGLDFSMLTTKQRKTLLQQVYRCLKENGVVFMNVSSLRQYNVRQKNSVLQYRERDGFWSPNPYYVFHKNFKYEKEHLLLDQFTIVEQSNMREINIWHQCYSPQTIAEELYESSFEVCAFFSNIIGDPYEKNTNEIGLLFHRLDDKKDEKYYLNKWDLAFKGAARFVLR
jgi:2-polyprenyl-3-methyl-5-hydroxy-6-metoxy-1,4-benzoquinol methylase